MFIKRERERDDVEFKFSHVKTMKNGDVTKMINYLNTKVSPIHVNIISLFAFLNSIFWGKEKKKNVQGKI